MQFIICPTTRYTRPWHQYGACQVPAGDKIASPSGGRRRLTLRRPPGQGNTVVPAAARAALAPRLYACSQRPLVRLHVPGCSSRNAGSMYAFAVLWTATDAATSSGRFHLLQTLQLEVWSFTQFVIWRRRWCCPNCETRSTSKLAQTYWVDRCGHDGAAASPARVWPVSADGVVDLNYVLVQNNMQTNRLNAQLC
jgi:ribosomal protein L37AE/L43A